MPNLNHSGPEGQGPKTGKKLGSCKKSESELNQSEELVKGKGKLHHSKNLSGKGKGKRTN
jgi:hypothetical protein